MKTCPTCREEKEKGSFSDNKSKSDGKSSICRTCQKKYQADWYKKNKKKHTEKVRLYNLEKRKQIYAYLLRYYKTHPCVDCEEKNPVVLEFDHVKGVKDMAISEMIKRRHSLKRIKKELKKCVVRCANCHKIKTAKDQGWFKNASIA